MSIVVAGSLAFDHIMAFPGEFQDHILPNKIHMLNVSFTLDTLEKQYGGTSGNICYNLALLGERPFLLASAGNDFEKYYHRLDDLGINLEYLFQSSDRPTASSFIITDKKDNQITGFYPGAMVQGDTLNLQQIKQPIDLFILSPHDKKTMIKLSREARRLDIPIIVDPGQQIIMFEKDELEELIKGSLMYIVNDYEMELTLQKTSFRKRKEIEAITDILIITKGEKGSTIYSKGKEFHIPIAKPRKIVDPTGAGDAYRAGIIKSFLHSFSFEKMGRVAALASAYAIETYGTQNHTFSSREFASRYLSNFGDKLSF